MWGAVGGRFTFRTRRFANPKPKFRLQSLPRPSYVVPFWVVYYNPLPKIHNRPKKELHRSPWVGLEDWGLGLRAQVWDARVVRFAGSWFRFKSEVLRLWDGGLCLSAKVQA